MAFISYNGVKYPISDKIIKISKFLETSFEDHWNNDATVELDNSFDEATFKDVITLFNRYEFEDFGALNDDNIPTGFKKPLVSNNLRENGVPDWYACYCENFSLEKTMKLMKAFDYMCCDPFIQLMAMSQSSRIKGKTPDEVFEMYLPLMIKEHIEFLQGDTMDEVYKNLTTPVNGQEPVKRVVADKYLNRFKTVEDLRKFVNGIKEQD
jgi:hypothetical protein